MRRPPEFITFTGADDRTSVSGMADIAKLYPVEWGILFSPERQGIDPRYPGGEAVSRFWWSGLRLSAHLCGAHSRAIMAGEPLKNIPADLSYCTRVQVNHRNPQPREMITFRNGWGKFRCIAQTRGAAFPSDTSVDWLFDASGGRGIVPDAWPAPAASVRRLVGYAGGLGPDNVLSVIAEIQAPGRYWLDMESGVRTDNRFDLDLCWRVCEAVYGARSSPRPLTTSHWGHL